MGPFAECHSTVNPEVYQKVLALSFFMLKRTIPGLLMPTPERIRFQSGEDTFMTVLSKLRIHFI